MRKIDDTHFYFFRGRGLANHMSTMGTIWDDWKEVAQKHGVSRELFERRLWGRKHPRWSEVEAAITPPNKWRRRIVHQKRNERRD